MIGPLVFVFGVVPVVFLGLLALVPLCVGLVWLFQDPTESAVAVVWAIAGLYGARALIQVAVGTYTDDTVPGLLAGIAAAAPLVYFSVNMGFPYAWPTLYFTAGPIVVATGYLATMLLFESADDARIVEYEEA